jgi:PAS domain S-box-containing protein
LRDIGSAAELSVSDTGTGIPAEALPRLFERFYRVETGHGRTYEGSGIGLSLVQQLVGLHGGAVRVQSEVGAGSTFYVSVPFGSAHLPQDQVRRPESPSSQARNVAVGQGFVEEALRWLPDEIGIPERERAVTGLGPDRRRARIVLADDNADMRQYVQRILATEYDVDAVTNGQEALNLIRQNPPDLVLSDVMMPDLDGFRLLAILRQDVRTRGVPVVLLSARAGEEARIEGLEAGADDYLVKPFGARELLARVRTNLELTQLRSRIARQDEIERTVAVVEQQRRLFDTALSNTPDFIYILDVEGRVTYANRALLALWGRQLHEAVGKNFFDLEHPEALATKLHSQVQQVIVTRQPLSDQTPFASRGGEMRHYEYIFAPVLAADGSVEAVAGSTRDITQRIKAEAEERYRQEQLRESARLESLGVLAGGVAHDFNNLLVGVIGNASLAQDALPPDHAASELIEEVLNAGEQAAHLTRQMLAYSGRGKFVVEPLNLSVLISEMVGLVRPSVPKKISLTLELAENLPAVEVDRGQIQQVLMNLVLNSADAIGSNEGTITVTTGTQHVDAKYKSLRPETAALPAGTYVSIEVRDTGCGMNEATRAKIFEPFFSTKFVGRGLGLAAVAGIVRGHNGVITVSSALDLGSCFTVLFPAAPSGAVPFPTVAVRNEPTGSGTVLLVDDERTVREMAKKALEHYGYAVLIAESGGEAVHLLKRHPGEIAAVVLDLSMPQMSGQEALPQLRTIRPQIKVIVSSGYSETEVLSLFRGQRVSGFIQKPYTPKGLAEKIKSCIG